MNPESRLFHALGVLAPMVGRRPGFFYRLAPAIAFLLWHLRPGMRRNVLKNQVILSGGDRAAGRRHARHVLANVVRYYIDLCTIGQRDLATFEHGALEVHGEQRLSVLGSGKPVIVLSAHLGSPELAVQAILGRGHGFMALVELVQPEAYANLLRQLRSSAGGNYVEARPPGLRACLRHLRAGGIVAIVGDRDIQGGGVCTTLASRHVRLPSGPFELARRTGATIVPIFSRRVARDRLAAHVEEPFTIDCPGDTAVEQAVHRWAALLDRHLGDAPGQWTVTEDFFKVHACG
jgi:KDO2-lipid IV(A) lauroyltransferase